MTLTELYKKVIAPMRDVCERAVKDQGRADEWHCITSAESVTRIG